MSDVSATNEGSGATPAPDSATGAPASVPVVDASAGGGAGPTAEAAGEPGTEGAPAAPTGPLLARVEAAAREAFATGRADEHNVLAWLHSHLSGAQAIVVGADRVEMSDGAKALVAEVRVLL